MAVPREAPFPHDSKDLDRLTPDKAPIEAKGEYPGLAIQLAPDLAELIGPLQVATPPPKKNNAAPAGTRNGVARNQKAGQPRDELYADLEDLLGPIGGALDRPLSVTLFTDATSRTQRRKTTSLRAFAATIRQTSAGSKADLPWFKVARFGDDRTAKGALRHDGNLAAIDGIEGDYDGGEVGLEEACRRLRAAGLAAVVYTTPSHAPSRPRWRVIVPTSRALDPADRDRLCETVNHALGGILAPESFTRSQAYYFGAIDGNPHHRVETIEGKPVDLVPAPPKPDPSPGGDAPDDYDAELASLIEPDWPRIREALAAIPADDREDWLRVGMALHNESAGSEAGFDEWSDWSRRSEKFNARDQARVWKSFGETRRQPTGIGTLFDLAKQYGWGAPPPPAPSRLTFLSPSDCEATPSRGYVIKGLVAPGDVACVFGSPGAGKSVIAPHLAYAVAQGRPAFGMRTKQGGVFYVAAEAPADLRQRVKALKGAHGDALMFSLVEGVADLLQSDSPDLKALREAVETQRPAIVIIDTLAMACPGLEENDAQGMNQVVQMARSLTEWGAAVILVHHSTKADDATPRGHSVLNGALDMALHVRKVDDSPIVRGRLTKNRNGPCDRDIAFTIQSTELGIDEDGDPITAPTLCELDPALIPVDAPKNELTPADVAMRVLRDLEDRVRTQSAASPDGAAVWVSEVEWREACERNRGVTAASPENRPRVVRRLVERLARDGAIVCEGDRVRTSDDDGLEVLP